MAEQEINLDQGTQRETTASEVQKSASKRDFKIKSPGSFFRLSDGKRLLYVLLSTVLMATAFKMFVTPGHMVPGGLAGLSVLINRVLSTFFGVEIPFSILNIALNAVPAIFAYKLVGHRFVMLSIVHIMAFSFETDCIPTIVLTQDPMLNALFGGLLMGAANAIVLNANASGGGTDFIAMIASNKFNITVWNYILAYNVCILTVAGFLFGFEPSLYSVIFQAVNTMVLNQLYTRYMRKTIFIITEQAEPISTALMRVTHHGITSFEGVGRYSGEKRTLLYMVVSKKDIPQVRRCVKDFGGHVFMNIADSQGLDGRFHIDPID